MNLERGYETLVTEKQGARSIGILLRTKEFTYQSVNIDMGEVHIDHDRMRAGLRGLLQRLYTPGVIYRTTGVVFSELAMFTPKQLSIFDISDQVHERDLKVSEAMSKLKHKYGENIISQGLIKKQKQQELGVLFEVG